MTPATDAQLRLEPVVSWPRSMTAGRPHLVAVDLRLAGPIRDWPYEEEEFAFTCVLDGSTGFSVAAVHDASVIVHRFGGSYGPAEFVVTPDETLGDRSLWLTIVTPRGVVIRTIELPAGVNAEAAGDIPTVTRPVLAKFSVARATGYAVAAEVDDSLLEDHIDQRASDPVEEAARFERRLCVAVDVFAHSSLNHQRQVETRHRLRVAVTDACRLAGVDPDDFLIEESGDGLLLLLPRSVDVSRVLPEFLTGMRDAVSLLNRAVRREARLRLRIALGHGMVNLAATGPSAQPLVEVFRVLDSTELRLALTRSENGDIAVGMTDELYRETDSDEAIRRLLPDLRRTKVRIKNFSVLAWISVLPAEDTPSESGDGESPEQTLYPVVILSGRYDPYDLTHLLRARFDAKATLLYGTAEQCAVLITDPGERSDDALSRIRAIVGEGNPDARVEFQRYPFRPSTLSTLRVQGPDGREFTFHAVPTTTHLADISQTVLANYLHEGVDDRLLETALDWIAPDGTHRRLNPDQMVHDAGLGDGDELRVNVAVTAGQPGESDDPLDLLLKSPDVHLIVDGDNVAANAYRDLPLADRRSRLLAGLAGLASRSRKEITCVFDLGPPDTSTTFSSPRGVRVLLSPESAVDDLIVRLVREEDAGRTVVLVSADLMIAEMARRAGAQTVTPSMLTRSIARLTSRNVYLFCLLDCSASMAAGGKIEALNVVLRGTVAKLRRTAAGEPTTRLTMGVITFSSEARWHPQRPAPIEDLQWQDVTAGGRTNFAAPLSLLTSQLDTLSAMADTLTSVIVLATDGHPTDSNEHWRAALDELDRTPVGRRALRMAIAIGGDADTTMLREYLARPDLQPLTAKDPEELHAAFQTVSEAVARAIRTPELLTATYPAPRPLQRPDNSPGIW
ncbi:NYN domain-containing protein [Sphaerisporangium viridialbum]|uniref:NYN domain-containing protein n=1 Tax=Sphaerisporangium viridialbum TaxID=46189 RepID=UPI003C786941